MPATWVRPVWLGWSIKKGVDRPRHMELDDELCLCFHVSKRKVINFLRVEKPRRESQLSECHGAGTGCGWCRPFLKRLFEASLSGGPSASGSSAGGSTAGSSPASAAGLELPSAQAYARGRAKHVQSGKGTPPPGATPIDSE